MAKDETAPLDMSRSTIQGDPIPGAVQEVLELFASDLADVRFPNVDHETLDALADAVRVEARELEEARQLVVQARARLAQRQESLMQRACQGVAYVRVFAAGDDALQRRVEELAVARSEAKPAKKKTRKRRRSAASVPAAGQPAARPARPMNGQSSGELPLGAASGQLIQLEAV